MRHEASASRPEAGFVRRLPHPCRNQNVSSLRRQQGLASRLRIGTGHRWTILRRDLSSRQKNACKVLGGSLAVDPYFGTFIRFVHGGASEVGIDHLVALSDAWQKGAATWPAGKRLALANDPLNRLAVDSSTNRSKGDGG